MPLFISPVHEWQRRYEALRASFVDRLPAKVNADRFGFSVSYVNLLRHLFVHEKIDFSEPVPEGGIEHIFSAQCVGPERFQREKFTGRHLLSAAA